MPRDRLRDSAGNPPPQDQGQQRDRPPARQQKNYSAIMIANGLKNPRRKTVAPVGPNRKRRPHPMQKAWETGYVDYLRRQRPEYEQQQQVNRPVKGGIEGWRENDYWNQFEDRKAGAWNGEQISGPSGQVLPQGALGFDYNADPIWESGWNGFWQKMGYKLRGDTQEEPDQIVGRFEEGQLPDWMGWAETARKAVRGDDAPGLINPFETGANVSAWYRSPGDHWLESGGKTIARVPATLIAGLFELGDKVGTGIAQGQSALQEVGGEGGEEFGLGPPTFSLIMENMGDTGAWMEAKIPPKLLRWIDGGLEMMNAATVLGHIAIDSDAQVEDIVDDVKLGWAGGYTFYSQVSDAGVRDEMRRRLQGGEDPILLARELENPYAEMIGRVILDPFTYVGIGEILMVGKAARAAKAVSKLAVMPEILKVIGKTDELHGFARGVEMTGDMMDAVKRVQLNHSDMAHRMGGMVTDIGLRQYTKTGKIAHVAMETGEVFRYIAAKTSGNPEDTAEALYAMWLMGSKADEDIVEAMSTLADVVKGGSMKPMLSENGTMSTYFLRQMFKDKKEIFALLKKSEGGVDEFIKFADDKMAKGLEGYFKTAGEVIDAMEEAGEYVNPVYRASKRWHEATKDAYSLVNNVFSGIYMGYSPGFASKNMMSNSFQMIVDQGIGAMWRKNGGVRGFTLQAIDNSTKKMLGWVPGGTAGFAGRTAAAGEDIGAKGFEEGASIWRKIFDRPTSRVADNAESWGASKTVQNSVRETLEAGLQEGRAFPTVQEFVEAGVPEDMAKSFINHVQENFGDVDSAMDALRDAAKTTGYTDGFKDLSWVNLKTKRLLRDYDLYEDLVDITRRAESASEAQSMWDDVLISLEDMIKKTRDDVAGMADDGFTTPGTAEYVEAMIKLRGEGAAKDVIENAKWVGQATNEAIDQAHLAYSRLSQAFPDAEFWSIKVPTKQNPNRTIWEALRNPGNEQQAMGQAVETMRNRAWSATGDLNKNTSTADMAKMWDEFDFGGEMPPGVTFKDMKNKIWDEWYFPTTKDMYRDYRELYFGYADLMMKDLPVRPDDIRNFEIAVWKQNIARSWDQVGRAKDWVAKAKLYDKTKHMPGMADTMLQKFGIRTSSTAGNQKYLKNIMNAYGGTEFKNVEEMTAAFKAGKFGFDDIDNAMIERLVKHSGMNDTWEMATQIKGLKQKKVNAFLDGDDIFYELVENDAGLFKMKVKGDSGHKVIVTPEWVRTADEAKMVGTRNVLSDGYVGRKLDKGTRLEGIQKAWREGLDISPKKAAQKADPFVAQVPVMITQKMRKQLKELGLTPAEIKKLTPQEAWDRLGGLPDDDVGKPFKGKAYRSPTGFKQDKGTTAADVLRHETVELGNDIGVDDATIAALEGRSADDLVWVGKKKGDVARYGDAAEFDMPAGSRIVGEDGEGGLLVLMPDEKAAAGKVDDVAVERGTAGVGDAGEQAAEEVADEVGFKLSYEWQPVPDGTKIPSIPGIKIIDIDGVYYTKISKNVMGAEDLLNDLPPIPYAGEVPSLPRAYAEQFQGIRKMMSDVEDGMGQAWGKKTPIKFNRDINNALQGIASQTRKNVDDLRYHAAVRANIEREFTLLNYGKKKNFDTILSQIMPYHFWYNRTYANWAQRVLEKPGLALNYHKFKTAMGRAHAGAPEWYKYNVNLQELGISNKPMYLNLEATLSPLYGITGVDFNDPAKRVSTWTRTLDNLGKYGPSLYTPLAWGTAVGLWLQGEDEASARWAGRMFPQTRAIKAGMAMTGLEWDSPGAGMNETDPLVWMFSGGIDPYERKRVGRYGATKIAERPQDEAAILEALHKQEGQVWNDLVIGAQKLRGPGDIAGFVAGVGFKARSEQDMQIDLMDQEYRRMWANSELHDSDWLRGEFDRLREVYPFMDAVLLSRKNGTARDKAYAYSVLGRMPPGWKDDVFRSAGVDPEFSSKFYDTKGDIGSWSESDRNNFMQIITDVGAVLDMPDDATRQEWGVAQDYYGEVMDDMSERFGTDIHTKIGLYYDLSGDRPAQEAFLQANPEVEVAMSYKDGTMKEHPVAAQYYMSISKLERYYNGLTYDVLAAEYPDVDWQEAWQGYNDAKLEGKDAARQHWADHPELEFYIETKEKMTPWMDEAFSSASKLLKSPTFPAIREEPEDGFSIRQQQVIEGVEESQNQQPPEASFTWEEWQGQMGPNLGNLVADFAYGNKLPPQAMDQLENMADRLDMSVNVMLEYMTESALSRQY